MKIASSEMAKKAVESYKRNQIKTPVSGFFSVCITDA